MTEPPGRPLVTRRDRRTAASRARILDAAVRCLAEAGYASTSTLQIQRRAGISRGGLLYHFPSKNALLVASVHHLAGVRIARAAARVADFRAGDGTPERIDEAVATMWERYHEVYFRAAAELWVAAQHEAELRATLGPAERKLNEVIHEASAAMFGPTHAGHPDFPVVLDILLTSMRGLALADAFEGRDRRHDRHLASWKHMSRTMLGHGA